MFESQITIPDQISTLALSKIWMHKALQNLAAELEPAAEQDESVEEAAGAEDETLD